MSNFSRRAVLGGTVGFSAAAVAATASAQPKAQQSPSSTKQPNAQLPASTEQPKVQQPLSSAKQEAARPVDPARPLAGRVAFVTGAARGIGLASAIELARLGADATLLDIAEPNGVQGISEYPLSSREDLDKAERLVRAEGVRALSIVADVRNPDQLTRAAERTIAELGGLDILVANAGVHHFGNSIEKFDLNAAQAMMDVNVFGVIHTVRAALPGLRRRPGGRIIIMSSIGGRQGMDRAIAYSATKWATQGLMKCIGLDLGASGITVNCVAPGPVDTPLHNKGRAMVEVERVDASTTVLPVSVLAPRDIARAVAFLAGPGGAWISGATIDVDAGRAAVSLG